MTPMWMLKFSFPRVSGFDSMTRKHGSVNSRKTTDDSDLTGVNDCRPARILYWFSDFITVNMSLVTTALFTFSFMRPDEEI